MCLFPNLKREFNYLHQITFPFLKEKRKEKWTFIKYLCWRRLLRVPWTARRSNQSILNEINPEYSLAGLMMKLKLQYFGHQMQRADSGSGYYALCPWHIVTAQKIFVTWMDRWMNKLVTCELLRRYTKKIFYTNYTKKTFMTQITTMVWSLTQSQTSWNVKWALRCITVNKASGGDSIPVELFQILKDDAVKVLY